MTLLLATLLVTMAERGSRQRPHGGQVHGNREMQVTTTFKNTLATLADKSTGLGMRGVWQHRRSSAA